jgi:hypothetical protein
MLKIRHYLLTTLLSIPWFLHAQDLTSSGFELHVRPLKVTLLNASNLSLNLARNSSINFKKQVTLFGLDHINVPQENNKTAITFAKKEPLSKVWNADGSVQNFGNKFKDTMYGVANGKFFTVNANQLGSSWLQQDAQQAHQKNGYRE